MALCLTLCEPMDCSPPGSSVHGILQATILEWIAISFSRGSSPLRDWTWVSLVAGRFFTLPSGKSNIRMLSTVNQGRSVYRLPSSFSSFKNTKVKVKLLSHVQIFVIPWTVVYQAPLSMGFSRQEHWSGLPFPSPMHESEKWSEVAQSCPTLRDPMDCSPPGFSAHGIFQARVLEWGAFSVSS